MFGFGKRLHPEQKGEYPIVEKYGLDSWHVITKPNYYGRDVLVFLGINPNYFEYRQGCTGAYVWGKTFDYYGKCIRAFHMKK